MQMDLCITPWVKVINKDSCQQHAMMKVMMMTDLMIRQQLSLMMTMMTVMLPLCVFVCVCECVYLTFFHPKIEFQSKEVCC